MNNVAYSKNEHQNPRNKAAKLLNIKDDLQQNGHQFSLKNNPPINNPTIVWIKYITKYTRNLPLAKQNLKLGVATTAA